MRPATRFSLLVFAPLYVAFLLGTLVLLPSGVLLTLVGLADATVSVAESAGIGVWTICPALAALGLLFMGNRLHALYACGHSHTVAWIGTWAVFSIALFGALWFGMTIVTSIGASDYEIDEFLRWTATSAALMTLMLQPGAGLWLYVSSRILRCMEPARIA